MADAWDPAQARRRGVQCSIVRLGHVYSNLMIDMPATNEKLRNRAVRMVELAAGVRWWILLKVQQIHLSMSRVAGLFLIGMFYNQFLPGGTGGDIVKTYLLWKETPDKKPGALLAERRHRQGSGQQIEKRRNIRRALDGGVAAQRHDARARTADVPQEKLK